MRRRGHLVLVAALPWGCFEDIGPMASSGTTPSPQGDTAQTVPTGGATDPVDPTTAGTDPTASTADETATTETGEPTPPLCGDGTPVAGELCLEETTVVMTPGVPVWARLGDVTSTASGDLVYVAMGQVVVHAGDGEGNFGAEIFGAAVMAERFELGHFDGDRELDMAALETGGPMSLLLGSGRASFIGSDQATVASDPRALALGDLDGDGALDAVVGTTASAQLFAVLGGGDGTLEPRPPIPTGGETHGLALADLDGDGNLDAALAQQGAQAGVAVAWGDGRGGLDAPVLVLGRMDGARDLAAGDLDGDGNLDLAYVSETSNALGVLVGDGDGGFASELTVSTGVEPSVLLAADLSGDGRTELVVGHAGESTLRIYGVEGGVEESMPTELTQIMLAASTAALHAGDVNDDGVLDLAATPAATEIVTIVLSTP